MVLVFLIIAVSKFSFRELYLVFSDRKNIEKLIFYCKDSGLGSLFSELLFYFFRYLRQKANNKMINSFIVCIQKFKFKK